MKEYNFVEASESKNLPAVVGMWGKIKSFLATEIDFGKPIVLELTPMEEKVLTEVHDFLFQEMSFKGFMDILKIGNDK